MAYAGDALIALGVNKYVLTDDPQTEAEFLQSFKKVVGENENGEGILSDDPNDFDIDWATVSAKMAELDASAPIKALRFERNQRLSKTDWWVLPDRTPTQAQLDYRQALRDITDTYSSLEDVVWPTQPE